MCPRRRRSRSGAGPVGRLIDCGSVLSGVVGPFAPGTRRRSSRSADPGESPGARGKPGAIGAGAPRCARWAWRGRRARPRGAVHRSRSDPGDSRRAPDMCRRRRRSGPPRPPGMVGRSAPPRGAVHRSRADAGAVPGLRGSRAWVLGAARPTRAGRSGRTAGAGPAGHGAVHRSRSGRATDPGAWRGGREVAVGGEGPGWRRAGRVGRRAPRRGRSARADSALGGQTGSAGRSRPPGSLRRERARVRPVPGPTAQREG